MTLPKGFGGTNRCPKCRRYLESDGFGDYICINPKCSIGRGKKDNGIDIPLSRWDIGRILFYLGFYGGILSLLTLGYHDSYWLQFVMGMLGFLGILFSTMFGLISTDPYWDKSYSKRKQLFFIFVPIANFINRINLKKG